MVPVSQLSWCPTENNNNSTKIESIIQITVNKFTCFSPNDIILTPFPILIKELYNKIIYLS